jgi:enoyl-CoA hydratase/carnithine racemase
MEKEMLKLAELIAGKSPVGIHALKQLMRKKENGELEAGLEYVARLNSAMLMTNDTVEAIQAFLQKRRPIFGKL